MAAELQRRMESTTGGGSRFGALSVVLSDMGFCWQMYTPPYVILLIRTFLTLEGIAGKVRGFVEERKIRQDRRNCLQQSQGVVYYVFMQRVILTSIFQLFEIDLTGGSRLQHLRSSPSLGGATSSVAVHSSRGCHAQASLADRSQHVPMGPH